jgi:hypothetical protein
MSEDYKEILPSITNRPSIQELFKLAQNIKAQPPINMSEDELKKASTEKYQNSIFTSKRIMEKYEELPQDVKDHYKWYGEQYYNNVIDTIQNSIDRVAAEHLRAVRAGLSPQDLTNDERLILRNVYGEKWYTLAGLESENN